MKALELLSLGLCFVGLMACAQKTEVPNAVIDAFAIKFPTASSVKWEKENDAEWEAEFKINSVEYSANFETNGSWKETEHEIKMLEVPEIVKAALMKNYGDYKVKESEISDSTSGIAYEFEIKKGNDTMEISIDNNGTVTKKNEKDDKENNDD